MRSTSGTGAYGPDAETLRILHAIHRLEPGGGPSSTIALVNALAELSDMEVHFAARPGPLSGRVSSEVRFHEIRPGAGLISFTRELSGVIKTVKPDVVHVHGSRLAVQAKVAAVMARSNVPLIATRHSHGFRHVPDFLASRVLNCSTTHTIALTAVERRALLRSGITETRVSVVPHALDIKAMHVAQQLIDADVALRSLAPDATRPIITIASRLVEGKGLADFISVISQLRSAGIPATGVVAGSGPIEEELQAIAERSVPPGAIVFTGYLDDVQDLLAASDCVLFLSEEEVLPVFIVEAMACNVPVIARRIDAVEELVEDGVSGTLVSDVDSAVAVIKQLLADPESFARLASTARETAAMRFSPGTVVRQLRELYERVFAD